MHVETQTPYTKPKYIDMLMQRINVTAGEKFKLTKDGIQSKETYCFIPNITYKLVEITPENLSLETPNSENALILLNNGLVTVSKV